MARVDTEWIQGELTTITAEFQTQYPDIPVETLRATVRNAASGLISRARIVNYLPILIRRRVKSRLQAAA